MHFLKDGQNIVKCFKLCDTAFHIVDILFKCCILFGTTVQLN